MSVKNAKMARIGAATVVVAGSTWFGGQVLAGMVAVHVVGALLHPLVRTIARAG